MKRRITLIPIGSYSPDLLSWISKKAGEVVEREFVVTEAIRLPAQAYDPRRKQYRGEEILAVLSRLGRSDSERVLGVIDADCYAPGLNFIFGQASLDGQTAFVALPRLRESFYGLPEEPNLFRERTLKEVIHELGHTWGLGHCPDRRCVMHFSNSLRDTDFKTQNFCRQCRASHNS